MLLPKEVINGPQTTEPMFLARCSLNAFTYSAYPNAGGGVKVRRDADYAVSRWILEQF